MAYRFNGSTDRVEFAIAPLIGSSLPDFTLAMFLKRSVTGVSSGPQCLGDSNGSGYQFLQVQSSDALRMFPGFSVGPTVSSTSVYYLIVFTSPSAGPPRYHIHNGTSWSHSNGTASWTGVSPVILGTDRHFVGCLGLSGGATSGGFASDIVCIGIKKANSADLTVETLTRTAFSSWQAFGFDWLIGFDSSLVSAGALQDQASPGTGDQVGISGTSLVSDPPGWAWAAAVTPATDFTGTPTSGAASLSVAFTDASTNTPTSWAWTFGDGGTSTSQNPTHSYTSSGVYTVTLVATNSAGSNTKTRTAYITVGETINYATGGGISIW